MKKLAIITSHPIQYQIPLFKNLRKHKIKPIVFFASKHGFKKEKIDSEFLQKIKWDNTKNLLSGYKSYFPKKQKYSIDQFRLSFSNLEKHLKFENINNILILGWNNLYYLKAFYIAFKNKYKIIIRTETNLYSKSNILKRFFKKIFLKFFFKKISNFLYIGKLNKEFYLNLKVPQKKLFPGFYFVDNNFFKMRCSKKKMRKKLRIKEKKIILFVGKFIERKNPFEFLYLAKLFKYKKNVQFLMIGDGILKADCQRFIIKNNLKNVLIKGFLNQKKLREYYWASDLLIVPSSYETWGLNINEAFASSIPVISTKNCGASSDLIVNGLTGYQYELGDLKNLSDKVNFILNNSHIQKKLIKNIKSKIKIYNMDVTINSLKKIINA